MVQGDVKDKESCVSQQRFFVIYMWEICVQHILVQRDYLQVMVPLDRTML